MSERTYFKPSNKTVDILIKEMNLPEDIKLSKDAIVSKILKMNNREYSTILLERYVNGMTLSKIEELHPEIYYSHTWSACNSAVQSLRKDLLEEFVGMDSFPLGKYMQGTSLHQHGYLSRSVKDIVTFIKTLNYKPSKDIDKIITSLEKAGYQLNYPKYLLRFPEYPYNLYSNIIQNDGIKPVMTAFELRRRYMKELIGSPTHNVYVFAMNVDKIFSEDNTLLSRRQKEVVSLYYIEKVRIPEISERLSISESLIKYELRKVIHILNSEQGKSVIYDINR